jgi:ER membrane protein complex subunit 3
MAELLIDPNIRFWVFLPIVVITFLVGIIRHYCSMLISSQKKIELTQIQDRYV